MKKIFLLVIITMILTPQILLAEQAITVAEVPAKFTFSDDWYVFTKNNIVNNTELEELGVTEEAMVEVFDTTNIVVNAALIYDDEFYMDVYVTYLSYEDGMELDDTYGYFDAKASGMEGFKSFMDGYSEEKGSPYKLYEDENSIYGIVAYESDEEYIVEYVTMISGDLYVFMIKSPSPLDNSHTMLFEGVLVDIEYDRTASENEIGNLVYFFVIAGVVIYACILQIQTSKIVKENDIKVKVFKTFLAWFLIGFQLMAVYGMFLDKSINTFTTIESVDSLFELWGANIFIIVGVLLILFNYLDAKKIKKTRETYEE